MGNKCIMTSKEVVEVVLRPFTMPRHVLGLSFSNLGNGSSSEEN